MNHEDRRLRYERGLLRQTVMHHVKREQELAGLLADLLATAREHKCSCRTHKQLRELAAELED